jgi:hypothetical protein
MAGIGGHVHEPKGPELQCACGWRLHIPPVSVQIFVSDGDRELVHEVFNCSSVHGAIEALRKAVDELENR